MNYSKIQNQAVKMAENAKPGILKLNNKIYTFEFSQIEWVYRVYEDGFLLVSFNTKSLQKAKQMLRFHLNN